MTNIKSKIFILLITLTLQFALISTVVNAATTPNFYFVRGANSSGNALNVEVRINGYGTNVDAVQTDFTYTPANLTFNSIDTTNSAFEVAAPQSGGAGTVSIARGTTLDKSGDSLIAIVKFTVNDVSSVSDFIFLNTAGAYRAGDNLNASKTNERFLGIIGPLESVNRLWNSINNDRLLTTDDYERDYLTKNVGGWRYEGKSFTVAPYAGTNTVAIYRLWNSINNDRLLTTDANEKNVLVAHHPGWKYEGVSFYALP